MLDDGKSYIEVIAGEYNGMKGPASTFSPVNLFNAKLKRYKGKFPFQKNYNSGMLVIEGEIRINDSATAPENNFVLFRT